MKKTNLLAAVITLLFFHTGFVYAGENQGQTDTSPNAVRDHTEVAVNHYARTDQAVRVSGTTKLADIKICNQPGIVCKNFVAGSASASVGCVGDVENGAGGWKVNEISGTCWSSLDVCFAAGTPGETCVHVPGDPAKKEMVEISFDTLCKSGKTTPDAVKDFCVHQGAGVSGATGDDMFKIDPVAGAFFEYLKVGGMTDPDRLKWISRNDPGAPTIMMPSGPANVINGETFSDYRHFLKNPPGDVQVNKACYPADITLCANIQPAVSGVCGAATLATYANLAAIPSAGFCYIGNAINKAETPTQITWNCSGVNGGADSAQCITHMGIVPVGDAVCGAAPGACGPGNTMSSLVDNGTTTTWECTGPTGGTNSWCSAPDTPPPAECAYANCVGCGCDYGSHGCQVGDKGVVTTMPDGTIYWECYFCGINNPNSSTGFCQINSDGTY